MPNQAAVTLSGTIRALILTRRLTNLAVARAASIAPSVVCRFMGGKGPDGETLDKIARALGVHVVEGAGGLRGGIGRRRSASSPPVTPPRKD